MWMICPIKDIPLLYYHSQIQGWFLSLDEAMTMFHQPAKKLNLRNLHIALHIGLPSNRWIWCKILQTVIAPFIMLLLTPSKVKSVNYSIQKQCLTFIKNRDICQFWTELAKKSISQGTNATKQLNIIWSKGVKRCVSNVCWYIHQEFVSKFKIIVFYEKLGCWKLGYFSSMREVLFKSILPKA